MSMVVQHINPSNFLQHCSFPSEIIEYKTIMFGFWYPYIANINKCAGSLFYYNLFDTPTREDLFQGKCEGSVFLASNDLRFVLYVFLFHPCVSYLWRLTMSHTLDELHQREILEQHYQQGERLFHLIPLEELKDPC